MENEKRNLIDRDDLIDSLGASDMEIFAKEVIGDAPLVDAVEVVHAHWFDIEYCPMWRCMKATCSHCNVRGEVRTQDFKTPDSPYCPACGAKLNK